MPRRPKIEKIRFWSVEGLGKYATYYNRETLKPKFFRSETRYQARGNPYDTPLQALFSTIRRPKRK